MRFAHVMKNGRAGLAIEQDGGLCGLFQGEKDFPGSLETLIAQGHDSLATAFKTVSKAPALSRDHLTFLPPLASPQKIVCLGINYVDHAAEGNMVPPPYPTLFGRFASGLIGHEQPLVRPTVSGQLDYEGELVAVIGRTARNIPLESALDYVMGYSIFNDGSIRDYQLRTTQWTAGKNFDGTGAFGPFLITSDELPPGCKGLMLETRLNGKTVQKASTSDMIFDVATTVSLLSVFMTLNPGDVLVMGTPSGVGAARKPPLYMSAGDVCEVEIEGLGILRNPVTAEATT
jgi:acylpyruvate hydrolase